MRLVAVTDTHDSPFLKDWLKKAASTYDLCLLIGDYGFDIIEDVVNITKKHSNVYAVMGNHDMPLSYGCPRILHGTKAQFKGYTIGGIGGSLPTSGWPFECDDTEYLVITRNMKLSPKVDILISHEPPYNSVLDTNIQKQHCGSAAIARYIEEAQPILFCSGHIHESSAIGKIGKTIIASPGPFMWGRYLEVDIVGQKVTRAKVFYDKALEWPNADELLKQSMQTWSDAPARSRKT